MSVGKPHRIRVRVLDEKPREPNKLKGQLVPHVDVFDVAKKTEFVICAAKEAHLEQVRAKLAAAGLEEIPGGATEVSPPAPPSPQRPANRPGVQRPGQERRPVARPASEQSGSRLERKPYGFVPLPDEITTAPPVWHDGSGAEGRLSGEIRCEIETLTPLLVGWERRRIDETEEPWAVPIASAQGDDVHLPFANVGPIIKSKSVLCPLRAPWGDKPVLLPADSIKGLLRHELGALLGAPMERVAERSYSYRPNSLFPNQPNPRLIARLARIADKGVETQPLNPGDPSNQHVRVPVRVDLLPQDLKYDKRHDIPARRYRFDATGGALYHGGQGAGAMLNSARRLHRNLEASPQSPLTSAPVPPSVQAGYLNTLRHMVDLTHGHFSERHPDVPEKVTGDHARQRILDAASAVVFQPGDLFWVEWDIQNKCIVSIGWHYYYRWAYQDTVRKRGWTLERHGLFPLEAEKTVDSEGAPQALSAVRRLFGYTGDNEGSKGIGKLDHEQLMGRIAPNTAIEVIENGETTEQRFLPPTFLQELGMPRPSAVEHYLVQPYHPHHRPSDDATLVTYGDAAGYDEPGTLAGRKFYLDRKDAYAGEPWKGGTEAHRNDRSTLALEASGRGRRFRFTVRFRDLDRAELAALLAAMCPHQFREVLGGNHEHGYCSKLGYARPLGWGSVRIEARELLLLKTVDQQPELSPVADLPSWLREHWTSPPLLSTWLDIHRCRHPDAAGYPRASNGEIYTYHTTLRAQHSRARRYSEGSH